MPVWRVLGAVTLVGLVACEYPRLLRDAPDGGPSGPDSSGTITCSASTDCANSSGTPVCDTALDGGTCVQCTAADNHACEGEVCKNDTCQLCTQHADCASHACLADGTCARADQVAYVRPTGSGTVCTDAAPCSTINNALTTNKPVIKVEGTITDSAATLIDGKAVQILGEAASLQRITSGTTLDVRNTGSDVHIYSLEIISGFGARTDPMISLSGSGIPKLSLTSVKVSNNTGIGISSTAGVLTLARSVISANTGGGILVTGGDFDITNNWIIINGGPNNDPTAGLPSFGGVLINSASAGTRRFEFNTVASNASKMTSGVLCGDNVPSVGFSNNIIFGNEGVGTSTQISGSACTWTFSDIGDSVVTAGTGNINSDPLFVAPNSDNYHLMSASPAKNAADPMATINIDLDGDPRPQGGRSDIGADELAP